MLADVFACPVTTIDSKEGPALGVALLAGVGAGFYNSVPEACDEVIGFAETCHPAEANTAQYLKYYEAYQKLYPALKDSFSQLRNI